MFIFKKEFQRLVECEKLKDELEKEVQRLADLITSQTKDCKMGVWCKDCRHCGTDKSVVENYLWDNGSIIDWFFINTSGGEVMYCKKHLHEICKEFEMKG